MTLGGWFYSTSSPPRTLFSAPLLPSCFATGHRPSEARVWAATQRDGCSHIIDWTLDKRSRTTSSAVWSSAVNKPLSIQTHTHTHTHACIVPCIRATWGMSKACKQANHLLHFSLFLALITAPEWMTNVRIACMGFLRKLFINWTG